MNNFPIEVELLKPVEAFGVEVHTLTINRPPVLGDLINAEAIEEVDALQRSGGVAKTAVATDVGTTMHVYAVCCGVPPSTMRSLSLPDWKAVQAAFAPFVSGPTGETQPSPSSST